VSAPELAQVECIAQGLLPPTLALVGPEADQLDLRDGEGVTIARWVAVEPQTDGSIAGGITIADSPTSPSYAALRRAPADVAAELDDAITTAVVGFAPPDDDKLLTLSAAGNVLLLAAAGGVRPDDAAHHRAIRAWQRAAHEHNLPLVLTPLWATAPDDVYAHAARAYGADRMVRGSDLAPASTTGAVVFFTGLSGSGKSTIAAELVALLTEQRDRTVTLLDGDVVRTHLSSELGFSKRDRDVNIRRIGWVAAEVAKHGGIAVAAPIAPYDDTRKAVRAMVEAQAGPGSFLLIHVSTPLEECERRDRKGLYARARAGEIPEFTGISDPYEQPLDADLTIDTTAVSAPAGAASILIHMEVSGHL
jgi:sulfate adenylyltransferase